MKLTSPEQMTGNNGCKTFIAADNLSLKSNCILRVEPHESTGAIMKGRKVFGGGLRHDLVSNSWHQTPLSLGA